jgi:mRNA interferase RelE/StbE
MSRRSSDQSSGCSLSIEALKGSDACRLRVGDWRMVFTSEPDRIVVHDIGPRGSIYD